MKTKTIDLTINNRPVAAAEGSTILSAAKSAGIEIPTLCYGEDFSPHTNCMLCTVHDLKKDSLVLACATIVSEGMEIMTEDDRVREARRDTLDLLLSEHLGDCEAPCTRACPAGMDIPLMIRQIESGDFHQAIRIVKRDIALPAVLGRICPAPCEKACRRKQYDNPVSICALKRFAADIDLANEPPYIPSIQNKSGKKVAVVGAGPAGLSAAWYIVLAGHDCRLFDRSEKFGGSLRTAITDDRLPKSVLDAEIELILSPGVERITGQTMGKDFSFGELREEYDAVVLTVGETNPDEVIDGDLRYTKRGIEINRDTFETSIPGVFAGGSAVAPVTMAIRSAAYGKRIAHSADRYLRGLTSEPPANDFNSVLGKLLDGETEEFLKEAAHHDRIEARGGHATGYNAEEAYEEAKRCFHCDCRKPVSCKLRRYAAEYGADQRRYASCERRRIEKIVQHDIIVFEPGKCIKCNLCIDVATKAGEEYGLTFINRGFDVRVAVPFDETLEQGLLIAAEACAAACPTGALALRNSEERTNTDNE